MKRKPRFSAIIFVLGFLATVGLFCRTLVTYNPDAEYEPAWSPDGGKIAFLGGTQSGSHLYVMDEDGSNIVQVDELGGALSGGYFPGPTWSPDGERIAYTTDIDYRQEIWLISIDDLGAQRLIDDDAQHQSNPIWSPNGNLIAYICNHRDVEESNSDNICLVNVNDRTMKRLTYFSDNSSMYDLSWQTDGHHIAFRKVAADLSNSEYYLIDPDGSDLTLLPFLQMQDRDAVWSPDGTRIAFTKCKCGLRFDSAFNLQTDGLYVMNSDGSQAARLMDGYVYGLSWSPDGRKLAFSSYGSDNTLGILVVNADGSELRQLTGRFPIFLCNLYKLTRSFC